MTDLCWRFHPRTRPRLPGSGTAKHRLKRPVVQKRRSSCRRPNIGFFWSRYVGDMTTSTAASSTPHSISPAAVLAEWCCNAEYVLISRRPKPGWYDPSVERFWLAGYFPLEAEVGYRFIEYASLYTPLQAAVILDGVDMTKMGVTVVPVAPDGVTAEIYRERHERVRRQEQTHASTEATATLNADEEYQRLVLNPMKQHQVIPPISVSADCVARVKREAAERQNMTPLRVTPKVAWL